MILVHIITILGGLLIVSLALFPLVYESWLRKEKLLDKAMRKIKGGKA